MIGGTEHEHQAQLFQWFLVEPALAQYRRWSDAEKRWLFPAYSVPNARKGGIGAMNYYKAEGLQPGFPDLMVAIPTRKHLYNHDEWNDTANGNDRWLCYGEWDGSMGYRIYPGLYIEMKAPQRLKDKKGGLQDNQFEWLDLLATMGYKTVVCYSFDEAKAAVSEYLGI